MARGNVQNTIASRSSSRSSLQPNEMAIGVREVAACSDTHSTVFLGHSAECANP